MSAPKSPGVVIAGTVIAAFLMWGFLVWTVNAGLVALWARVVP